MAVVKLGNGITEIRGGYAGIVFKRGNYGQNIQSKPRTIKRTPSTSQRKRRNAYRTCINYIGKNAGSQLINRWAIYAEWHPRTNKLGKVIILSWLQMFMSINVTRVFNDTDILQYPPE